MTDVTVWIIIIAFYAPLHYLGPTLVAFITGTEEQAERKSLIIAVLIDCTLSLAIGFSIVIWLIADHLQGAMLVMFLSLLPPYAHIWIYRSRRGSQSQDPV